MLVTHTIIWFNLFKYFSNIKQPSFHFSKKHHFINNSLKTHLNPEILRLLIGFDDNNTPIYIDENGLYQNILITGTIGTGKTSSAMYPFTYQLMDYCKNNNQKKIGMLILDVKGNYAKQICKYAIMTHRENDVVILDLSGKIKYNPLDKPNLKANVLANRLRTILSLFSKNNSESYWLDKA